MGPALSTKEIRAWGPSRGLSKADTEQLIAVGEERDDLRNAKAFMITTLGYVKGVLPKTLEGVDFSREDFANDKDYKEALDLREARELVNTSLRVFGGPDKKGEALTAVVKELREILAVLSNPGPVMETMYALAERKTASRIKKLLEGIDETRNNDEG